MRLSCSEAWMGEVVECPLEWRMDSIASRPLDVYASTNLEDRDAFALIADGAYRWT